MQPASRTVGRRIGRRSRAESPASSSPVGANGADELYLLRPAKIWAWLKTQPVSFWAINAYMFFEYVRPQSIYPALEGPPWAQMTIAIALGALLLEGKMLRLRTEADGTLLLFTVILLLSSVTAYDPAFSFSLLSIYLSWVLIYLLITSIVTTERRFLVFMLAFLLYNFKMSQHATRSWASAGFAFRNWGTTGAPGWFQNSGEFGIQMTIFIPLAFYFLVALRPHWGWKMTAFFALMLFSAVLGTIGSSSRGAMLGAATVALFMFAKTKHKLKGGLVLAALGIFAYLLLPEESLDRFRSMGSDDTSVSRKIYWAAGLEALRRFPVLGIGFGNWHPYMGQFYDDMGLPHNIFIQAAAELGYLGLFAFLAMIAATFTVNYRTRKMLKRLGARGNFLRFMAHGLDAALIGFLTSGFFVTVLYYPYFWINLAMTVALRHSARSLLKEQTGATVITPRRPVAAPVPRPL